MILPGLAGLFSIHLIAFDKARNYKVTRRLVLYDSNSHVSHNPFFVTRLQTGSPQTNYTWVVKNTTVVKLIWPSRFRNALHSNNKWLDEVLPNRDISQTLDDFSGVRTIQKINNTHGKFNLQFSKKPCIHLFCYQIGNQFFLYFTK